MAKKSKACRTEFKFCVRAAFKRRDRPMTAVKAMRRECFRALNRCR